MYRTLTYFEWLEQFKPMENHITNEGYSYETYGDELDYVSLQDDKFVWTELDGDDGIYIVNGYHFVNRLSYFITNVPAPDEFIQVVIVHDAECQYAKEGECHSDCVECNGDGYVSIYPDSREDLVAIYGEEANATI